MKVSPTARILLIGGGSIATLISIFAAVIFYASSGLTKVADNFFKELKEGNTNIALKHFSEQALNQSSTTNLNNFRIENSLDKMKSLSWSNRTISIPDSGELTGTINLKNGQKIPLTLSFKKSNTDWKIYSIKQQMPGIVATSGDEELPSENKLIQMTNATTDQFVIAIQNNDFTKFHAAIANSWSEEIKPKQFKSIFKEFTTQYKTIPFAKKYYKSLSTEQPVFTKKPLINSTGSLFITGKYKLNPILTFTYGYTYEGLGWKLVSIKMDM